MLFPADIFQPVQKLCIGELEGTEGFIGPRKGTKEPFPHFMGRFFILSEKDIIV